MKELNINVRVQIGITDALCGLLSAFVKGAQLPPALAMPTKPAPAVEAQPAAPVEVAEAPAPEPEKEAAPAPAEPEAQAPAVEAAPAPAPAPEPAPAAEPAKEFTEVDVRAAMDRTRRRIEGENYKEDTDSEGYKRWHRKITGWFKTTAAIYGADKPSALPDHASRAGFIEECDKLYVENGELTIGPVPF